MTPRRSAWVVAGILVVSAACIALSVVFTNRGIASQTREREYNTFSEQTCVVAQTASYLQRCTNEPGNWVTVVNIWVRPLIASSDVHPVMAQLKYPIALDYTAISPCLDSLQSATSWGRNQTAPYLTNRMVACYANKHYRIVYLLRDAESFDTWNYGAGIACIICIILFTAITIGNVWQTRDKDVAAVGPFPEQVQSPHRTRSFFVTPAPFTDRRVHSTPPPVYHNEPSGYTDSE